jgi:hypothetical protein
MQGFGGITPSRAEFALGGVGQPHTVTGSPAANRTAAGRKNNMSCARSGKPTASYQSEAAQSA